MPRFDRCGLFTSLLTLTLVYGTPLRAQSSPEGPLGIVTRMVTNEDNEAQHHDRYEFTSNERSERTGGHVWTERVVETASGRVRLLTAEDGKPLSPERQQAERQRLQAIVTAPSAFLRAEQSQKNDEAHAREMLDMLPRAFLFDNVRLGGGVWRIDFHPNPGYSPSGIEEHVLHGMSGYVVVDAASLRLLHIEGVVPTDVSIGFGLLATIRAGSHFSNDRADVDSHWRTVRVLTDIRGKAALFKTVARNSDITRSGFHYLDPGITIPQAVALLLQ